MSYNPSIFAILGRTNCKLHRSNKIIWQVKGERNNTDRLYIIATVSRRDIIGSKWTFCPQSRCVRSNKNGLMKGFEGIWQGPNHDSNHDLTGWDHGPKVQRFWGCSRSAGVSIKSGPRRDGGEPATGSLMHVGSECWPRGPIQKTRCCCWRS